MKKHDLKLGEISKLDGFSGKLPIFPLPTVVFFPHTYLPLRIFEPRYTQMISDAMAGEKMIGMALFKPGWEKHYDGNPEVHEVVGMGRIVNIEEVERDRYNIVLYGLRRARIVELVTDLPYRVAKVDLLEETVAAEDEGIRTRVLELLARWNSLFTEDQRAHMIEVDPSAPLSQIADELVSSQIPSVAEKQKLLGELEVERRLNQVLTQLETRYEVVSLMSRMSPRGVLDTRDLN